MPALSLTSPDSDVLLFVPTTQTLVAEHTQQGSTFHLMSTTSLGSIMGPSWDCTSSAWSRWASQFVRTGLPSPHIEGFKLNLQIFFQRHKHAVPSSQSRWRALHIWEQSHTESAGVQRQEALCLPMLETHYPAATREHSNNTWKVHVSVHWWDQLMQMAKWLQRASVPSWIQTQFTHSTLSLTTQLL